MQGLRKIFIGFSFYLSYVKYDVYFYREQLNRHYGQECLSTVTVEGDVTVSIIIRVVAPTGVVTVNVTINDIVGFYS